MDDEHYTIGEFARLLGVSPRTVDFYTVVHALVADHLLQQLHGLAGQGVVAHGPLS